LVMTPLSLLSLSESLAHVDFCARCTVVSQHSASTYCNLGENEDISVCSAVWSMSSGAGSEYHGCTNMRGESN
jgi:hypothetical protein